jgi:hypothetical protein
LTRRSIGFGLFSPEERARIRERIVAFARDDTRVTGGANTGSAAIGAEDRWSDIDLAFRVARDLPAVMEDFSRRMYGAHGAVAHVDVRFGRAVFRVFLLGSTLQVDLAFWPAAEFGALGPSFKLIFGDAPARPPRLPPDARDAIGPSFDRNGGERGIREHPLDRDRARARADVPQ